MEIKSCPRKLCSYTPVVFENRRQGLVLPRTFKVMCSCGWEGQSFVDQEKAIEFWNDRRKE